MSLYIKLTLLLAQKFIWLSLEKLDQEKQLYFILLWKKQNFALGLKQ